MLLCANPPFCDIVFGASHSGVVTLEMAYPKANALGFKLVSEVSYLYPLY